MQQPEYHIYRSDIRRRYYYVLEKEEVPIQSNLVARHTAKSENVPSATPAPMDAKLAEIASLSEKIELLTSKVSPLERKIEEYSHHLNEMCQKVKERSHSLPPQPNIDVEATVNTLISGPMSSLEDKLNRKILHITDKIANLKLQLDTLDVNNAPSNIEIINCRADIDRVTKQVDKLSMDLPNFKNDIETRFSATISAIETFVDSIEYHNRNVQ